MNHRVRPVVTIILVACSSGCAVAPYKREPLPTQLRVAGARSEDVYTAVLRALHMANIQVNPAGTNRNGQLIETKTENWVFKNGPSMKMYVTSSLSILVDGSKPGHTDILINIPWSYRHNGFGSWADTALERADKRVRPKINRLVANLRSQFPNLQVTATSVLQIRSGD